MLFASRHSERGGSFASCLLATVVLFGGLGLYYFNYFQWRHLEAPLDNLVYVDKVNSNQLNSFRKTALARVCDSTGLDVETLGRLRKATKKGTTKGPNFEQDCKALKYRLRDVIAEARLKRIPKKFKPRYSDALMAIHYNYKSILALEAAVASESKAERVSHYREATKLAKTASDSNQRSREYFHGSEWAE